MGNRWVDMKQLFWNSFSFSLSLPASPVKFPTAIYYISKRQTKFKFGGRGEEKHIYKKMADAPKENEKDMEIGRSLVRSTSLDLMLKLTDPAFHEQEQEEAETEDEAEEKESSEDEVDLFELLGEEDEESEEQQLMYREYLELAKEIECQNELINDMKDRIRELQMEPCLTPRDKAEIKRLNKCIAQEYIRLDTMINRIMQLQNFGSARLYDGMELAMSVPEENMFDNRNNQQGGSVCPPKKKR